MKIYCAKSYKLEDVLAEYSRYLGKNVWVRCCRPSDYDEVMRYKNRGSFRMDTEFIRPLDVYEENGVVYVECDWVQAYETGRGTYDFQHRVYYADHLKLINPDKVYKTATLFKAPTYKNDKILDQFVGSPIWIGIKEIQDSHGWGDNGWGDPISYNKEHIKILSKDKNSVVCYVLPSDVFTYPGYENHNYCPSIEKIRKYTDTFEVVEPLDIYYDSDIQEMVDAGQLQYKQAWVY